MSSAFLLGRMVVGGYFLYSGVNHFLSLQMMSGYAASKGVPMASAAVAVSGLLLLVAGFSFLLGVVPKVGVGALVLFMVPVTVMMHPFWRVSDPAARMADMVNFTKNFALLGSALMFLAIPEPWPLSLQARLRLRQHAHA